MFASRDRGSVKSAKNAGDRPATPQSDGVSTLVKQNADAAHANGAASTPPKQAGATPQPIGSRPASSRVASTNGAIVTTSTSLSETSEVSILVKSTNEVSSKYQSQLSSVVSVQNLYSETLESFLDFIATDRLRRVPHQGSRWDKILRLAEHFAIRISHYEEAVRGMFSKSEEAAHIIWGSCRVLLQMGPHRSDLLEATFGVLFKMSLEIPILLRNRKLFAANKEMKQELGLVYVEILLIVTDATIHYTKTERGGSAKDFHDLCGQRIDSFYHHREQIYIALWSYHLEHSTERGSESPREDRSTSHCLRLLVVAGITYDIQIIREWLAPKDPVLRRLLANEEASRTEYTCEWFEKHLMNFSKSQNDLFRVIGSSGCGKSVLATWIVERLQRPLEHKSFDVVSVKIAADLKTEARSFNIVKRLLAQILEQNPGNVILYNKLCDVFEKSGRNDATTSGLEEDLWKVLDSALSMDRDMMIVIDGLNHMAGGETAIKGIYDKLDEICTKRKSVKCIVLTQPPSKPFSQSAKYLSIEPKTIHEDMYQFIYHGLNSYHHFHDRKEDEKQSIVHRLVDHVKGNFIFAGLIIESLRKEKSHSGFTEALKAHPKTLHEAIERHVSRLEVPKTHSSLILSWLLAAERPLTLSELQCLLETQISNEKHAEKTHNINDDIHAKCGSLVVINDDIVRIRHISIRQFLLDHLHHGSSRLHLQDCQRDLVTRCLAYVKYHFTGRMEPTLERPESRVVEKHFHKHHLLEYTVRYWTAHFRACNMFDAHGAHKPSTEFTKLFPDSVAFVLLEWTCWDLQYTLTEAVEMHLLALKVRKTVMKEHESILQSLMTIAITYEKLSIFVEASKYYYQASKIAQTVVGRYSQITTMLASAYLKCTASITVTEHNEVSNCKEEMIILIISAEEHHHHGSVTKETISWKKMLAKLYKDIKEIALAVAIQHEIYRACAELYGESSSETMDVYGGFNIALSQGSKGQNWEEHILAAFIIAEKTMKVIDRRRIDATLRLFEMYEIQKNLARAEEIIVMFLQKITYFCLLHPTTEHHQRKIEIIMVYVRFLTRHSRKEEAKHILRGVWCEYEHQEITTVEWAVTLKIIAEELKKLSLLTVALSVFHSVWGYFKKTGKKGHVDGISVAIYIAEISQEIQETFTEEVVLEEVYELTLTQITTTTKIETSTITTCEMLSTYFANKERWSDVVRICDAVLKKLWGSLATRQGTPSLPKDFYAEAIKLATRQAYCHYQLRHIDKAEQVYVYVYQASKNSLRIGDEIVFQAAKELIEFYESISMLEKALKIGKELQESYLATLGVSHSLTLEILYLLGNLSAKHNIREGEFCRAEWYYLEIYTNLDKGSDVCHKDAIDAAMGLIRLYRKESRWIDCQKVYGCIWRTVIKRGKEYAMEADFVDNAYHNYIFVLEKKIKEQYRVLVQVSVEYRDVCIELYGRHAEISLKALIQLAAMYERSEEKRSEAMKIYEVLVQETKSWSSISTRITTILVTTKSRLAHLYLTSTTVTTETLTKAIVLLTEQFEHTKSQHGCSHHTTLEQLRELINLHKRQGSQQTITVAIRTIRACSVEVITKETDYMRLFDAAVSFANNYITLGHVKEAHEFLYEMRRQIIFRDFSSSDKCGFKLDHSIDRRSYVFLIAFEETLKGSKVISFSSVMADLLTETILFEMYTQAVKQNNSFETILLRGARLRAFQKHMHYDDEAKRLEDDLLVMFRKGMGSSITTSQTVTYRFFIILLEELGKDQPDLHIINSGWIAGTRAVHSQIEHQKWQDALELATAVWQFTKAHRGLHSHENIQIGIKISLALVGRGQDRKWDHKLYEQMLEMSKTILRECFEASRYHKVKFAEMDIKELNELVGVLGQQQNFTDLEWLLTLLWNSRDEQTSWSSSTIIWIGRRLVEVRFAHGQQDSAISLLEDIIYNIRRVWGSLDRATLEMCTLLSELYTATGRHKDAMAVHEGCLYGLVNDELDEPMPKDAGKVATAHAELLKRGYQRNGGWGDKEQSNYMDMWSQLQTHFGKDESFKSVQPIDKWPTKGADNLGIYVAPANWEFLGQDASEKHENVLWRLERGGYDSGYESGKGAKGAERKGNVDADVD